nr:hypothetical protein JVH1_8195 [Rhodococcus sp. JVH1]
MPAGTTEKPGEIVCVSSAVAGSSESCPSVSWRGVALASK